MSGLLNIIERAEPASSQYECVEIYLPKRLKHLSELYDSVSYTHLTLPTICSV